MRVVLKPGTRSTTITAFDQNPWPHLLDQLKRRILLEDDHQIDGFEPGQDFGAGVVGLDRAFLALEALHRCVAVEPDHQPVAGRTGLRQHPDVAGVQ